MTENNLEKNLRCIALYNRELEKKISGLTELEGNFEIKYSKSEDPILYKNNIPVDDPVDPVWNSLEEYKKIKYKLNKSITFLIGFGLGYRLREFAARYQGKIIIYEPDINLLRIVFEIADFSDLLKKNNIKIVSNYSELENIYQSMFFIHYKLNVLCSEYYLMNESGLSNEIKKKLEDLQSIYQSNYRNLFQKNFKWTDILFKNIPSIVKNPDLDVLKDKFKGKTAVIIAAGPSLDKNIQDLKEYRDEVIVFCVGTALKTAIKNGIIPDFVVAVETFESTFVHLNIPEISDINLILSTRVYPDVYKLKAKRIFNYHGQNAPASKWLGSLLGKSFDLYKEAGTVSLTAYYAARIMGFDKLIFIGQDLAYTDNKCYSQHTLFGGYKINNSKKIEAENISSIAKELSSEEERVKKHTEFLNRDILYVKGNKGDKVLTTASLLLFIKYFEEIAEKEGENLKLINATEGGAFIEGFEHVSLKEALDKHTSGQISAEDSIKTSTFNHKQLSKRKNTVLASLKEIIKNTHQAETLTRQVYDSEIVDRIGLKEEWEKVKHDLDKYDYKNIDFKNISKTLSQEEKQVLQKIVKLNQNFNNIASTKLENVFYNNIDDFSQILKLLKTTFIRVDNILNKNPYIYNLLFDKFLSINHLIKDFDGSENCLQCMPGPLNKIMWKFYFLNIYSGRIKNIINELES